MSPSDDNFSHAPWTPEEVAHLAEWQSCGHVHPFTCGHCRDRDPGGVDEHALVPTVRGWICPTCDHTQGWCHRFMLDGPGPNPLAAFGPINMVPVAPTVLVYAIEHALTPPSDDIGDVIATRLISQHAALLSEEGFGQGLLERLGLRIAALPEDHPGRPLFEQAWDTLTEAVRERAARVAADG